MAEITGPAEHRITENLTRVEYFSVIGTGFEKTVPTLRTILSQPKFPATLPNSIESSISSATLSLSLKFHSPLPRMYHASALGVHCDRSDKQYSSSICQKHGDRGSGTKRSAAKSRGAILATHVKMADFPWTRRAGGRPGRTGAPHPRSRRTTGSGGRSVYVLQTMALFPREKRDTTVK